MDWTIENIDEDVNLNEKEQIVQSSGAIPNNPKTPKNSKHCVGRQVTDAKNLQKKINASSIVEGK